MALLASMVLALLPLLTAEPARRRASEPPDSAIVILLGTGAPYPDPAAQGPATAVVVGERIFLFDAGPGVMRQMTAAGLPVRNGPITRLFLTHLHTDHTLGLPDVIFTSWVMGRRVPLRIVGPVGTRAMTDHLLAAWAEDVRARTEGLERGYPAGERVAVEEIAGGRTVYDSGGVTITAVPAEHGSWQYAFAYRIDAPGKSILLSGDTRPSAAVERSAQGVDLLIHEVYPAVRLQPEPRPGGEVWPQYMRSFHTSDRELGALAARAKPKLLVLYHIVRMAGTDEELLAGIRAGGFTGTTVIGRDLNRF